MKRWLAFVFLVALVTATDAQDRITGKQFATRSEVILSLIHI